MWVWMVNAKKNETKQHFKIYFAGTELERISENRHTVYEKTMGIDHTYSPLSRCAVGTSLHHRCSEDVTCILRAGV